MTQLGRVPSPSDDALWPAFQSSPKADGEDARGLSPITDWSYDCMSETRDLMSTRIPGVLCSPSCSHERYAGGRRPDGERTSSATAPPSSWRGDGADTVGLSSVCTLPPLSDIVEITAPVVVDGDIGASSWSPILVTAKGMVPDEGVTRSSAYQRLSRPG